MDGLSRCLGCPVPLDVAGSCRLVRPMTLRRLGMCEAAILSKRTTVFDEVCSSMGELDLAPSVQESLGWEAYNDTKADRAIRTVAISELQDWMNTPNGLAFTAWLCLGRSDPFATLESSSQFVRSSGPDFRRAFARARDMASGTDLLSTFEWPSQDPVPPRPSKSERKYSGVPWKRIFRFMAQEYRMNPREVGRLTMWNLKIYTLEEEAVGGKTKMSLADMKAARTAGAPGVKPPPARNGHARTPGGR